MCWVRGNERDEEEESGKEIEIEMYANFNSLATYGGLELKLGCVCVIFGICSVPYFQHDISFWIGIMESVFIILTGSVALCAGKQPSPIPMCRLLTHLSLAIVGSAAEIAAIVFALLQVSECVWSLTEYLEDGSSVTSTYLSLQNYTELYINQTNFNATLLLDLDDGYKPVVIVTIIVNFFNLILLLKSADLSRRLAFVKFAIPEILPQVEWEIHPISWDDGEGDQLVTEVPGDQTGAEQEEGRVREAGRWKASQLTLCVDDMNEQEMFRYIFKRWVRDEWSEERWKKSKMYTPVPHVDEGVMKEHPLLRLDLSTKKENNQQQLNP